ncbi:sensor histidine kinase [Streptomyces sp. NPDC058430]|uniref:sensor histidine kinase n=1 Tax=Streptomyces sp. NPDC058430 TaxID=3346495 RepID=UPI00365F21B2
MAVTPATVTGWPVGLCLAVDNLLDNAVLHCRPDGSVDIHLAHDTGRSTVRITIGDDGPGIPPDQRYSMKERFTRGTRTRAPGSGLSLALVDQQTHLHHGTVHLGQSPAGGLEAALVLPGAGEPGSPREHTVESAPPHKFLTSSLAAVTTRRTASVRRTATTAADARAPDTGAALPCARGGRR